VKFVQRIRPYETYSLERIVKSRRVQILLYLSILTKQVMFSQDIYFRIRKKTPIINKAFDTDILLGYPSYVRQGLLMVYSNLLENDFTIK